MSENKDGASVSLVVDARGLSCPLPLLRAKQGLNKLSSGETLKLLATDSGSVRDIRSYAELSGNSLLSFTEEGSDEKAEGSEEKSCYVYLLQKA